MLLLTLVQILELLVWITTRIVIVQFVVGLLIAFNVINLHNRFVAAVWQAVNALLDPILNPIRRLMPATGAIDFSPMVLIILLTIAQIVLGNLEGSLIQ